LPKNSGSKPTDQNLPTNGLKDSTKPESKGEIYKTLPCDHMHHGYCGYCGYDDPFDFYEDALGG